MRNNSLVRKIATLTNKRIENDAECMPTGTENNRVKWIQETFDKRCEEGDGSGLASTSWKIQSDLLQFVSERSSTVLRLGAAT